MTDLRASLEQDLGATATEAGDVGLLAWVTRARRFRRRPRHTAFGGIDGVLLLVALGAIRSSSW